MSAGDIGYRISIALPGGPPPAGGFPAIYLLDADAGFATVVETHRRLSWRCDATGVLPAVIVGIGHGTGDLYDTALRERDYVSKDLQQTQNGGAETFLDFIETRLKPEMAAMLPINPNRQALIGHSLSGYFTLWVMVRHTQAFQSYVAVSPSLWRDDGLEPDIRAIHKDIARVFIAVGEWEEALAPWQKGRAGAAEIARRRAGRRMIGRAREFSAALQARIGSERVHFEMFPDEDHASVFGIAVSRAMRGLFGATPWRRAGPTSN